MADLEDAHSITVIFRGHVVTSKEGQLFYRPIPRFALDPDWVRKRFWRPMTIVMPKLAIKGCVILFGHDWRAPCV